MDITTLLTHFPQAILKKPDEIGAESEYRWFLTPDTHSIIGFPIHSLSAESLQLLNIFLTPYTPRVFTPEAEKWKQFIHTAGSSLPVRKGTAFRLVSFAFYHVLEEKDVQQSLQAVFSESDIILFTAPNTGYVVEQKNRDTLSKEELSSAAQALETDFSIHAHFFTGTFHKLSDAVRPSLLQELEWANTLLTERLPIGAYSIEDLLAPLVLKTMKNEEKSSLFRTFFDAFQADPELVTVIRTYVEHLANTSSTAKALYLHRNSLQYRLDRFSERTGIDLKSFQGALFAYLACLEWENKS